MSLFLTKLLSALTSSVETFFSETYLNDVHALSRFLCICAKSTFNTFFIKITNFQDVNISK